MQTSVGLPGERFKRCLIKRKRISTINSWKTSSWMKQLRNSVADGNHSLEGKKTHDSSERVTSDREKINQLASDEYL